MVVEEGSYEKDVSLYVQLGEPRLVGGKLIFFIFVLAFKSIVLTRVGQAV